MSRFGTLRTWATFLKVFGVLSVISAAFGVISLAVAAEGFWNTLGVVFLGAPLALLLASWPIALGQAMGALADIGDTVAPDPL
jgi:hypothetical protein